MSKELSNACDFLLSSTSILSHKYGVLKYNSQLEEQELKSIETKYFNSYSELIKTLDNITYLHTLSELKWLDEEEINIRYNEIVDKFSLIDPSNLNKFLEVQRDTIKTQGLLTNYLQIILPTMRSIHHSDLTITESNTLKDLDELYSSKDGIIYRMMNKYKEGHNSILKLSDLKAEILNLLNSDLKPKLKEMKEVEERLNVKREEIFQYQKSSISEIQDKTLYSDIKDRLSILIKHWDELLIICDLLPTLVIGLSIDWFQDEELYNIITDCERIGERIRKYRAAITEDLLRNSTFEEIVMINFNELD